jgi:acyl-CoA reductase-like NAD-dependent aldehyde dehydrogenase
MNHVHRARRRPGQYGHGSARAETLTAVSLGARGKDPRSSWPTPTVERAANHAVYYSMLNGGQTCVSVERVYVEAPVFDEFVAEGRREGAAAAQRSLDRAPARPTSAR